MTEAELNEIIKKKIPDNVIQFPLDKIKKK